MRRRYGFQSTLPAWGETSVDAGRNHCGINFNPLSPHGERPLGKGGSGIVVIHFNPLSPHGERRGGTDESADRRAFQSTLPAWGETTSCTYFLPLSYYFNPLSPHGERQRKTKDVTGETEFQSTLPAWGETLGDSMGTLSFRNFNPLSPHGERPPFPRPFCA